MWNMIDDWGNYYLSVADISQDFAEIMASTDEVAVIKQFMTDNRLPVSGFVVVYSNYIIFPLLNEHYWKEKHYFNLKNVSTGKKLTLDYSKLELDRLEIIYSSYKKRLYLTGYNQTENYYYRRFLRSLGREEKIPVKKNQSKANKVLKSREFTNDSYYKVKGCNCDCVDGIYYGPHIRRDEEDTETKIERIACPYCKRQRKSLYYRDNKLKLFLNMPESSVLVNKTLKDDLLTIRVRENQAFQLYGVLLNMYIEGIHITPVSYISNACRDTTYILILRVRDKEDRIEVENLVREREVKGLRTVVIG